jgi:hypothetical protein
MGQYHKLINLDKQEVVEPNGLGLFSKQYEHTGVEASLADAIYLLVMSSPASGGGDWPEFEVSGRWCGDRVIVLGDYTREIPNYEGDASKLWGESDEWKNISTEVREALGTTFGITYKVETKVWADDGQEYESVTRQVVH